MFPAPCDYVRAASAQEAVELLGRHGPDARLLAGGHSLVPLMKLRLAAPSVLIDIGRIDELKGVAEAGEGVRIGPLTTHAELHASELLLRRAPLLAEAAGRIGDPQVRNKGTIGGNLAHADPASDLPGALVALGATLHLLGPDGERTVEARGFFHGLMASDLGAGEIITAIRIPAPAPRSGACYLKVEHPASGYAVVGAAAVMSLAGDGSCAAASLAFNGVTAAPFLAADVGASLAGGAADDAAIEAAVDGGLEIEEPLSDNHASGAYRVALAHAYGKRALERARDRAGG